LVAELAQDVVAHGTAAAGRHVRSPHYALRPAAAASSATSARCWRWSSASPSRSALLEQHYLNKGASISWISTLAVCLSNRQSM
jgi:hypothetical protein